MHSFDPHPSAGVFHALFGQHPAHVAMLDQAGVILAVNDAWTQFGRQNDLPADYAFEGSSYLGVCAQAAGENHPFAQEALVGLLRVLNAGEPNFVMVYPCHSATEQRWFRMWVESQLPATSAVIVAHTYLGPTAPPTVKKRLAGQPASGPTLLHASAMDHDIAGVD